MNDKEYAAMFKERPTCFVAIPESDDFTQIRKTVEEGLQSNGVEPLFYVTSSLSDKGSSANTSIALIERSDVLIADVTDRNPNIYYELGLADALRKPILIFAQRSHDVPSDLAGHRVLVYEPNDTEKLSRYLDYWIKEQSLSS